MIVSYVMSALIGVLLIVTGSLKLREGRQALSATIQTFRLVPRPLVPSVTAFLPAIEIAIGVALVMGAGGPWPLAATVLIGGYTAAVMSVIVRNIATDCGCFGSVLKSRANWAVVARNAVLLLVLVACLIWPPLQPVNAAVGWSLVFVSLIFGAIRLLTGPRENPTPASDATTDAKPVLVPQIGDR